MQTIRTNLSNNASTQYSNFNFNSMTVFNGMVLAAGDTGFFHICTGDDDAGSQIDAYFIPYTVDFNDDHPKRLRRVYIGGQLEGGMNLTVTGNGDSINGPQAIEHNADEVNQVKMFSMDRGVGLKWVYADFKFENVAGSFFAIDSINAVYSLHARRRN